MSRRLAATAVAALALALTACSGGGGTDPYASAGSLPAAPPEVLTAPTGTVLTANSTAQLGVVVIDGLGWTLYRSDADSADPPTATCVDACATAWPPVLAEPGTPLSLEGVEQQDVGTVVRPDGGVQVTVGGWPVYRHAADPQPGATDGHGKDGWSAVTPTGARAEAL
jgi:predicted lipoprotein with Yx(FWY)xxD motif